MIDIMNEVTLLLNEMTPPEEQVTFKNIKARADVATIQNSIRGTVAWTWASKTERIAQSVSTNDIGKEGWQSDEKNTYKLTAVTPINWEVQSKTNGTITWKWGDLAQRVAEPVKASDIGKLGLQADQD